jgi:tRNA-intron endonuclease
MLMKEMKRDEKIGSVEVKIKTTLSGKGAIVQKKEDFNELSSRGYGTTENGKSRLNIYETLFLVNKGLLEVYKTRSKTALEFKELLHLYDKADKNIWFKYLIYRDLRSRGYVVREGFGLGITFRVYERGEYGKATATYLILGIQEGKPITVKELAQVLKHTQSLKKKLVIAVVNRRGEIVYYTLTKLTMK